MNARQFVYVCAEHQPAEQRNGKHRFYHVICLYNDSASARINQSNTSIRNNGHGVNWSNSLIWRKTFAKEGRTLSTTFSNTYTRNHVDGYNLSRTTDYNRLTGAAMGDSILNQQSNRSNNTNNAGLVLSYTEPLGRDKIWEVNYGFNTQQKHIRP